jgi:ring-1,2-phenylacetyl-CoA epoxidase subunit PaaD
MVMKDAWELLEKVKDPEVPVLTIVDLGIVREIHTKNEEEIEVVITPTYSGCPAMDVIGTNINTVLRKAGYQKIEIKTVLSPAWTTDWLSEKGKQKLEAYGIAPPVGATTDKRVLTGEFEAVKCPQCKSENTKMISQFGSTACKALFQCQDCLEPFDYFKCH